MKNDDFTVVVSGSGRAIEWACVLCGCHIQNERVEQRICIRFCVKLEHSSAETTQVIQKAAAIGNWWLAASSQQCTCLCIMSCAECFGETSDHTGDSTLLQPRFGALWLLAFSKTKITFVREETSNHRWDSGKYDGAADGDLENCVSPQGAYFEGDWGIIVLCTMFLVSCIFFIKCLYFHITWLDTFWSDLI